MSKPKTRHIRIEEHVSGDRLAQNPSDGKQILAMIKKCRKIAKYAENGTLEMRAEAAAITLTDIAAAYGFIAAEETTNDNAEPETDDTTVAKALTEQSPAVTQ
jgi:hypothetical protein